MYAIRHKKTHEWVYGTDYQHQHDRKDGKKSFNQLTSLNRALIFEDLPNARFEAELRGVSRRYYEIVEVELNVKLMLFYADNMEYFRTESKGYSW